MNSLFRPLLRTAAVRNVPLTLRAKAQPIARPLSMMPARVGITSLLHARGVASTVSGRPGSQTLDHAATNVKEELGNSAADLAKVIAGANVTRDAVSDSSGDSFVGLFIFLSYCLPFWLWYVEFHRN